MDSAEFHAAVYDTVRRIPPGRVTSYGHIAKLIGMPRHSRFVGQALRFLPATNDQNNNNDADDDDDDDQDDGVPWQRVLQSSGCIASRGPGTDGASRQKDALEADGVEVIQVAGGGWKVDLRTYGWFPASL